MGGTEFARSEPGNATTIGFRFTPEGSGARLTVVEPGFAEVSVPAEEREAYDGGGHLHR